MSDFILEILEPIVNVIEIETSILDTVTDNIIVEYDSNNSIEIVNTEKLLVSDMPYGYSINSTLGDLPYIRISGLTEGVQDIIGSSISGISGINITYDDNSGLTKISLSNPVISTNNIIDFNSGVSGLLSVKNITPGNNISISNNSGNFTINSLAVGGVSGLFAQSGIGYVKDAISNAYTLYNYLINDTNDSNITISLLPLSDIVSGASGSYYVLGLANNLSNINNISITGDLSVKNSTFIGNINVTGTVTANGNIISNNVNLTDIINKLVPAQPPLFPGSQSLSISTPSLVTRKLCSGFSPALNNNSVSLTAGSQYSVGFSNTYTTSFITGVGPGTTGTIGVTKNTIVAGTKILTTGIDNGTYSDLIINNDRDYSAVSSAASGFWQIFDSRASGSATSGWNTIKITSTQGTDTNLVSWYYDANSTNSPSVTSPIATTGTGGNTIIYSSSVPHYSGSVSISFNLRYLSGDTYNDNFINNVASPTYLNPISAITRPSIGLPDTLSQNYLVSASSGISMNNIFTIRTNLFTIAPSNSFIPSLTINNSSNTTSFTPTSSNNVLIKTLDAQNATILQENYIPVGTSTTLGSAYTSYGVRISGYPNSIDTPASGILNNWNSTSRLGSGDAAVVGGILSHNITDYSSYIPTGPNLGTAPRSNTVPQYFTFKTQRTSVGKLNIVISAPNGIAGLWFKLPGTNMDTSLSTTNGWSTANSQYADLFNASNQGCAETAVVPLNTSLSNITRTITFGTNNSSNSTNNEIHIRIKLSSGQTITSLSLQGT